VTIYDSNGKTNFDTSIVFNNNNVTNPNANTDTSTNTNTNTNTTTDPTPPVVDPVVEDPIELPDSQTIKSQLVTAMQDANNGVYPTINGGWYYLKKGYTPSDSNKYFFEYGQTNGAYNLDVTIYLTTFNMVLAADPEGVVSVSKNLDGSYTASQKCIIRPGEGKNKCSFLMHAEKSVNFRWVLDNFSFA